MGRALHADRGARGPANRVVRAGVVGVTKNLLVVCDLEDTGHRIVFDSSGRYYEHKQTGVRTPFRREGNVYEVDYEVVPYAGVQGNGAGSVQR